MFLASNMAGNPKIICSSAEWEKESLWKIIISVLKLPDLLPNAHSSL